MKTEKGIKKGHAELQLIKTIERQDTLIEVQDTLIAEQKKLILKSIALTRNTLDWWKYSMRMSYLFFILLFLMGITVGMVLK